jgi:hypothetical protein
MVYDMPYRLSHTYASRNWSFPATSSGTSQSAACPASNTTDPGSCPSLVDQAGTAAATAPNFGCLTCFHPDMFGWIDAVVIPIPHGAHFRFLFDGWNDGFGMGCLLWFLVHINLWVGSTAY